MTRARHFSTFKRDIFLESSRVSLPFRKAAQARYTFSSPPGKHLSISFCDGMVSKSTIFYCFAPFPRSSTALLQRYLVEKREERANKLARVNMFREHLRTCQPCICIAKLMYSMKSPSISLWSNHMKRNMTVQMQYTHGSSAATCINCGALYRM